jgi:hypothetical protein
MFNRSSGKHHGINADTSGPYGQVTPQMSQNDTLEKFVPIQCRDEPPNFAKFL